MPLQQVQLDQSIYGNKTGGWGASRQPTRSPYAEALTPQKGEGATTEQRFAPNRWVEIQKEEWAKEDKLRKAERDRKVEEAQEMGMRIRAAYEERQEASRAQSAKIEADMEAMAMELYAFATESGDYGLDDEGRQNILRQVKTKPKLLKILKDKGLIMADGSDFVRKAGEPVEPEAPSWSIQEGILVDKTSGAMYKVPESVKEDKDFDYSKIVEFHDAEGNLRLFYGDEPLAVIEAKEKGMSEAVKDVFATAKSSTDAMTTSVTLPEDKQRIFKQNLHIAAEAANLSEEEMTALDEYTGVFKEADRFKAAGLTKESFDDPNIKEEFLNANPGLTAVKLQEIIDAM